MHPNLTESILVRLYQEFLHGVSDGLQLIIYMALDLIIEQVLNVANKRQMIGKTILPFAQYNLQILAVLRFSVGYITTSISFGFCHCRRRLSHIKLTQTTSRAVPSGVTSACTNPTDVGRASI